MVIGLISASQVQIDLFAAHDWTRSKQLMSAIETINEPWGTGTLRDAPTGIDQRKEFPTE